MSVLREWGKATVLVTHDLAEAFQLADRIVIYDDGRIVQAAPKSELLSRPASEQVARLLGVRNILRGTVLKATPEMHRAVLAWLHARGDQFPDAHLPSPARHRGGVLHPTRVRPPDQKGPGR